MTIQSLGDAFFSFLQGGTLYYFLPLLFVIFFFLASKSSKLSYRKKYLFTKAEVNFLRALDSAISDKYRIFGKVRIADVIVPGKGLDKKTYNKHFWQISSKHFDYVLCDKHTLSVVCVIELNDKSHQKRDRKNRDILVKKICTSANMPLVWITATRNYDTDQARRYILEAIQAKDKN